MQFTDKLVIIDPDYSRRAWLAHGLANAGFKTEPFADPRELGERWPEMATFLVSNANDGVKELFSATKNARTIYPVLAYSVRPRPEEIVDAVLDGALEYLEWPFAVEELCKRIQVLQSRYSEIAIGRIREARAKERLDSLSRRERQVLNAMVDGNSNKAIAEEYHISPRTVEIHRANMMKKVGAHTVAEALKLIYDAGIERQSKNAA